MKRMVALVPNARAVSPGQRFRIETWEPYLRHAGWSVELLPFESDALHAILYERGRHLAKAGRMVGGYVRQVARAVRGLDADLVLIHREATLIGPALAERIVARQSAALVYDIDDPIFVPYRSPANGWLSVLKCSGKTRSIFRLADHTLAVNEAIAGYARSYCRSVSVFPNCVHLARYAPAPARARVGPLQIGWVGSHTTLANLDEVAVPMRAVQHAGAAPLRVVSDAPAALSGVAIDNRQWTFDTEVADMATCDVAVVPVADTEWNRWKYPFKLLQCMAMGLPVVASRFGCVEEVVDDGVNGFLVTGDDEWRDRLLQLGADAELRLRMGAAARRTVEERYSLEARLPELVACFDQLVDPATDARATNPPSVRGPC